MFPANDWVEAGAVSAATWKAAAHSARNRMSTYSSVEISFSAFLPPIQSIHVHSSSSESHGSLSPQIIRCLAEMLDPSLSQLEVLGQGREPVLERRSLHAIFLVYVLNVHVWPLTNFRQRDSFCLLKIIKVGSEVSPPLQTLLSHLAVRVTIIYTELTNLHLV